MTWQYNGSKSTIDEFRTLSREMQYEVIDFIKDFMIYEELTVNGKNYLLVHGGLGNYYPGKDIEEYSLKELIWDSFDRIEDFCYGYETTTEDVMIILGDAGINYWLDLSDKELKGRLSGMDIIFFCVHGNH